MQRLSVSTSPAQPAPGSGLGPRLRRLRRARGLTLQTLSHRSGLSIGYLSQIERKVASPSAGAARRIAAALDITEEHLAPPAAGTELASHARARHPVQMDPLGLRYEQLHRAQPDAQLISYLVTLPPGYRMRSASACVPGGEEMLFVHAGQLEVETGGVSYCLGPRDSLHLRTEMERMVMNRTGSECTFVWMSTAPLA